MHFINMLTQDKARVLAEFYGTEKVDEYEGHRTVAPPDLGNAANLMNVLKAFRHQLYIYKFVEVGLRCSVTFQFYSASVS